MTRLETGGSATHQPRGPVIVVLAILGYHGFTLTINGVAAPGIMGRFDLGEQGIAELFAWISVSALGSLFLARLGDRVGRHRVLLWCMIGSPLWAIGAGMSESVWMFAIFEVLLFSFAGAAVASSIVWISETLPTGYRATGQGYGGMAVGMGAGLCVLLMPLLDSTDLSWRWLLFISGAGVLGLPLIVWKLHETGSGPAKLDGIKEEQGVLGVFGQRHRRHAVALLVCSVLVTAALTTANPWRYFHAVTVVGLSPAATSMILLASGGLAMVGFPLGATLCDRIGRVPTVAGFALLTAIGIGSSYWGPPSGFAYPLLWLGLGYFWFGLASNAMTVGENCAATELFPPAVRGTMAGWFHLVGAFAQISAQATVATLATGLGGISNVVGCLGLLGLPVALIYVVFVQETRGLPALADTVGKGIGARQSHQGPRNQ
ncbi:MAG: MFS transporter [Acidiferrobacterales bacterium]